MARVVTQSRRRSPSSKQWAGFTSGTSWNTLGAATSFIVGSFTAGSDLTLLRTRGLLAVLSDSEVEEEIMGAIGITVATEDAFGQGVNAIPTPISDIGSDQWVMWTPFAHARAVGSATGQSPAQTNFTIDSKAMRKFHADQRLVVVIENDSASFGMRYHLTIRTLVMLRGTGG